MSLFDTGDLEMTAIRAYESASLDPANPVRPSILARHFLGPNAVIRPPSILGSPAVLLMVNGAEKIAIKRSVPKDSAPFLVAHELAHWLLRHDGFREGGEVEERAANYLAGALMAPRPAFRRALSCIGQDFRELADAFSADETFAALRESEVTGRPRVVVTRSYEWVKGDAWAWPERERLRTWAHGKPGPGVRKTRITDRPKRYVLDVEDLGDVG